MSDRTDLTNPSQTNPSQTEPGQSSPGHSAPRRATRGERLAAGLLAAGCLGVLIVAAWLQPDGDGHGTHTQLGMNECAWAEHFDAPCATCGMTTSFAHAAAGDWTASVVTQPFAALLVVLTSISFWGGLHVSATGSRLGNAVAPVLTTRVLFVLAALFLLAWGYKWAIW